MARNSRRALDRFRTGLVVFLIAYPLISGTVLAIRWSKTANEIYPFFSWALFCFVPGETSDLGIRVTAIDGEPLDPPRFVEESTDDFPEAKRAVTYLTIQKIKTDSTQAVDPSRVLIEKNVLLRDHKQVDYELVKRRYDCLERHRDGTFRALDVIDRYHCELE